MRSSDWSSDVCSSDLIEDILLTYVLGRVWDDRRLVVPVSYFLEKPFQNLTRETSDLLGTVFFHVYPGADIARIRKKVEESAASNPRWDKRVAILQVTEHRPEALELRALLSASNAGLDRKSTRLNSSH